MKKIILSILLCSAFFACKKERTCSCTVNETVTTITTPRSAGSPSTVVQENSGNNAYTYDKVRSGDLKKFYDCNTKTTSTANTGTTTIFVKSVEAVNGFTFTNTKSEVADYSRTRVVTNNCEVK